jgi:2-hydroxy-6-oxonona-2,4-dienedioate hydrolase
VLESGAGAPELLLLHGAGSRADRWRHNIGPLADGGRRVLAVDFPGHGFADKGDDVACSLPAYVEFVHAAIQALELQRPILIGTSLGGHVAARVALDRPEGCAALIMVGPTGLAPHGAERRARTAQRLQDTTAGGIEQKLTALVHDPSLVTTDWVEEERRVNNSPGAVVSLGALARYFTDHLDDDCIGDDLDALSRAVPTLLVWGAEDTMVPVDGGRAAVAAHQRLALVEIEHAGHAPYFERPAQFNEIVSTFISSVSPAVTMERHTS